MSVSWASERRRLPEDCPAFPERERGAYCSRGKGKHKPTMASWITLSVGVFTAIKQLKNNNYLCMCIHGPIYFILTLNRGSVRSLTLVK